MVAEKQPVIILKHKQVMTEATSPKLFGGFNTSLTWKNIDLNASFGFSLGGKIYNYSRQEYELRWCLYRP